MIDTDKLREMAESERALLYLDGHEEILDALWWCYHWQWKWSEGWKRICQVSEALCLMAWEADPPELSIEDDQLFEAIAVLNAFARTVPFTNGQKQIYWLKREAIEYAMSRGLAFLRLVVSRRTCRTCGGDGVYNDGWIDSEDGPCKRCGGRYSSRFYGKWFAGRGYVDLRFHEVNIADRYTFHQPADNTTPFAGHQTDWLQPTPTLTWGPNQPGRPLPWEQATSLVTFLKHHFWAPTPHYRKGIYTYMNQEPTWR